MEFYIFGQYYLKADSMKYCLTAIITFFTLIAFAQSEALKLASDVWPPFTNVKNEKAFALDLVKEALARTGRQVEFTILEFDEVILKIDAGEFDGSAALWISDERKKKYFFSDPYLHNQLILVGNKGSDVSAVSFEKLAGKRIGVVENYAYGTGFSDANVIMVKGASDQQNLERLLSGKVDYMLVDDLLIQYLLKYQVNDVREFLEVAENPILVKSLHFAVRRDLKNAEKIVNEFNGEIGEMIADGTYNKILELSWVRADVDGDGSLELILSGNAAGTSPPQDTYNLRSGSIVEKQQQDRFYINGKFYNNWEQVPEEYKKEIVMSAMDPKNTGIKLNFK
jgi:ABC-type amino acid transport substrate-binding protein